MTLKRSVSIAAISLALVALLTGCFGAPSTSPTEGEGSDLVGTSWSGTDSDGDEWGFDFQQDGTVGLTFAGNSFDDSTDTWAVAGGTLRIDLAFDDGAVVMTGPYSAGATSIDLEGAQGEATWTVTITQ